MASLNLGMPNKSVVNFEERVKRLQLILRLSVVKPLGFEWMKRLYDYIKSQPHLVSNGFKDIHDYLKQ